MRNIRIIILILITLFSFIINVDAHKRAKYNIIIDTDAGVDDFRALSLFMASRDFNINAITTVDGVLPPDEAASYVYSLIELYHHEGIIIGEGKNYDASKEFYEHALPIWQNIFPNIEERDFPSAVPVLEEAIRNETKRSIIIAMGPLSNIEELVKLHPELLPKIEMILWYSDFNNTPSGYNFEQNKEVFKILMENKIPVKLISSAGQKYQNKFIDDCKKINSIYANTIVKAFESFDNSHLYYWDDFLPLYLLYPSMFSEKIELDYARTIKPRKDNYYDILVTGILNSEKADQGVVFNEMPVSGYMIRSDVGKYSQEIINIHGYTEFKIVSLTSEFHSHMGIYSILGAKLGLRIIEYFHAGLDEIEIISYAGYNPPVSCFNDGLQVGTGSTIGYGTISVDTSEMSPSVLVIYNNRKVRFSLKPSVIEEINSDIENLIKLYGLTSEMYWIKLREIAIEKYWLGYSRYDLFEITKKAADN